LPLVPCTGLRTRPLKVGWRVLRFDSSKGFFLRGKMDKENIIEVCFAFVKLLQQKAGDKEIHLDSIYLCVDEDGEIEVNFNSVEYGRCGDTDIIDHHVWISAEEILEEMNEND